MILVFASKSVGFEALEFLVDRREPIARVIVGSSKDLPIIDLCKGAKCDFEVFSGTTCPDLLKSGRRFDWLLNLWCPHILKDDVLALAARRANLHPGLVPYSRGNDCAAWIIRKREPAGVSILEMNAGVDEGDVYAQRTLDVPFPTRGRILHDNLQKAVVNLFREAWPDMAAGKLSPTPQPNGGSYHRRRDTNADRLRKADDVGSLGETIDWMLAHDFGPGTTAEVIRDGRRYKLSLNIEEIAETKERNRG